MHATYCYVHTCLPSISAKAGGKSLSNMAKAALLKRMKRDAITVNGFRATFRDWAREQTRFPHELCEMALDNVVGNKAETANRRGDLFDKRRLLMDACKPSQSQSRWPRCCH